MPEPLVLSDRIFAGEPVVEARVGTRPPFFLAPMVLEKLQAFVDEPPNRTEQFLAVTGAVKSGKSAILSHVLPALIALRHATRSRKPAVFVFTFRQATTFQPAAYSLYLALSDFGKLLGININIRTVDQAYATLAADFKTLAQAVLAAGCQLYVLLDEIQAPIVSSTPADAQRFVAEFKSIILECKDLARFVVTGSSLLATLWELHLFPPNGFRLWTSAMPVRVGDDPSVAAARAIVDELRDVYTVQRQWSEAVSSYVTADLLQRALTSDDVLSFRPALIAAAMDLMGNAKRGTPAEVFDAAVRSMRDKMLLESLVDISALLPRMPAEVLRALRAVATGAGPYVPPPADADGEYFAMICNGNSNGLQPPYGHYLAQWVSPSGVPLVAMRGAELCFTPQVFGLLTAIVNTADAQPSFITATDRAKLSRVVLDALAAHRISGAAGQPVRTVAEVAALPAIRALLHLLSTGASKVSAAALFDKALHRAAPMNATDKFSEYEERIGFHILRWLRHVCTHEFHHVGDLVATGLTPAVIDDILTKVLQAMQWRLSIGGNTVELDTLSP